MNAKSRKAELLGSLIQPPLDPTDPSISGPVGDGIEQGVGTIDRSVHAAHALVPNSRLDRGA